MTVNQHELLSAFIDGELDEQELDQLLILLNTDENARADYLRYQQTSDFLHGYVTSRRPPIDLTARIKRALDDEAPLNKPQAETNKARVLTLPDWFWKQTAGLAAAASIGALAVIGVMNQSSTTAVPQLVSAQSPQQNTTLATSNRWTVGEEEVEDRLNNYLVDHNEYAGASGMFSYARVVSYSEE